MRNVVAAFATSKEARKAYPDCALVTLVSPDHDNLDALPSPIAENAKRLRDRLRMGLLD